MSNKHPEALRLADELDRLFDQLDPVDDWRPHISDAGDELRRLHAEVEALRSANDSFATASILPDDKAIVDRAEVEAQCADAYRYRWPNSCQQAGARLLAALREAISEPVHELARQDVAIPDDGNAETPEETARQLEREACAQVCEGMHDEDRPGDYANAIRSRGAA